MNASELKFTLERLFFEEGDAKQTAALAKSVCEDPLSDEDSKKIAADFLSKIKIDPLAYVLYAAGIIGIVVEIAISTVR